MTLNADMFVSELHSEQHVLLPVKSSDCSFNDYFLPLKMLNMEKKNSIFSSSLYSLNSTLMFKTNY